MWGALCVMTEDFTANPHFSATKIARTSKMDVRAGPKEEEKLIG